MSDQNRPVEILLVEDNPGDVLITREAFEGAKLAVNLVVRETGDDALAYLSEASRPDGPLLPDLILLDLNLPGVSGLEVLEQVRADATLGHIPVVVMTSSTAPEDVRAAYERHASSFVTKPIESEAFIRALRAIEEYWFTIVRLPTT